jgi:hypothetical protein
MTPDQWLTVALAGFGAISGGAGVYAAIKSELARTQEIALSAKESAGEAHQRIDTIFLHHQQTRR